MPLPEQPAPVQPAKIESPAGAAVNVTTVPDEYVAAHCAPQLIPAGIDVTDP